MPVDTDLECPQCEKGKLLYTIKDDKFTCDQCAHVATPQELGSFDDPPETADEQA